MRYKDEFIQNTKKIFEDAVILKKIKEDAHSLVNRFFADISHELKEEQSIGNSLKFDQKENSWSVSLERSSLIVLFGGDHILVNVRDQGFGYEDALLIQENGFYSKKYGEHLSEELLDTYLKEAFDKVLKAHL